MFNRKNSRHSRMVWVFILLAVGMLAACGRKQDESVVDADRVYDVHEKAIVSEPELSEVSQEETVEVSGADEAATTDKAIKTDEATATDQADEATADGTAKADETAESKELRRRFGSRCITEQTFEVELSEYDGRVWFVPSVSPGGRNFQMQIIQGKEVLKEISTYVPEELAGEKFVSLDAVAFFDINYDNETDIVLIETYGDTTFTVVYYGETYTYSDGLVSVYFDVKETLSDNLTSSVENLTIPAIRDFLSNGKKNGEFEDYREAYLAAGKLREAESDGIIKYNLIFFDDDDIPELVADYTGYYVSMYTYHDGRIYTVMDEWVYGAGGNHGYDYCPRKGSVRNYDTDYAGLILWTTYWTLGEGYELEPVVSIEFLNFIDENGNGRPDGDESETVGYGDKSYIDGVEITLEEELSYSMGEYEWLGAGGNDMGLAELAAALY